MRRQVLRSVWAVFRDDDGRLVIIEAYPDADIAPVEYDLGFPRPGRYVWAQAIYGGQFVGERFHLCDGGGRWGDPLRWPSGDAMLWLTHQCKARAYHTRLACQRHFLAKAGCRDGRAQSSLDFSYARGASGLRI